MLKLLRKAQTVPRWIILFVDVIIAAGAFTAAALLTKNILVISLFTVAFIKLSLLYIAISVIVLGLMRIHTGMIRFTNSQDMLRIFSAVLVCNVLFFTIFSIYFSGRSRMSWSADLVLLLLVSFSVQSSLMVMLRTVVRSIYFYIKYNSSANKTNVFIYGTTHNSLLLKQALEASAINNFYVAGFVESDSHPKINKFIEQRRVYALSALAFLKERLDIQKIVLPDEKILPADVKQRIIESSLQAGIRLSTVPPSDQWLDDDGPVKDIKVKNLKIEDILSREPIVIDNLRVTEELLGKRILITGAAGSIGSEIVRQVCNYNPAMVVLCDQAESPLHDMMLELKDVDAKVTLKSFIGDVRNYRRMRAIFKAVRPDIVFHAAAYKHVPLMEDNPLEAIQTNVLGTKNIADLAVFYEAQKFVMISTDKAVNPTNIMGASKRIAEIYIQSLNDAIANSDEHLTAVRKYRSDAFITGNTQFITTRFGNVLGSNGSVVPLFKAQIKNGGPVTVTHPEITRYFMTIPEAVQLVLEAGATNAHGKIFVFDMGEPVKIADMAAKMIRLAGFIPDKEIQIVFTGLRPGEKLYEELLNDKEYTQPTHHEKINIANVRRYDYKDVAADIEELIQLAHSGDETAVVTKMKAIVPEYVSNNSHFQSLDKKLTIS